MADFAQILIRAKDDTKGAFDSASRNIRGLESAASKLGGVLSTLGVGAGLSVAGFAAFAKSGIDAADAMNDMSLRTGVAVKTLAEYKLAADQNGTSVEAMAKGIQKLTLSMGQAEQGSTEQAQALKNLGVSARDPQKAFEQLADAVANSNDPIKTNADLQKVLGKNYAELLPLLQGGAQGLRDSAAASQTFAEQMAKLAPDADKFNDNMAKLKTNAAGAAASLLNDLVPAMNRVFDRFSDLGKLRDSGASLFEIITGGISADSKASLDKVQRDIANLEARKQRLGTTTDPATQAELARLKAIRATLIDIAVAKAQAVNAQPSAGSTSETANFSAALSKKSGLDKASMRAEDIAINIDAAKAELNQLYETERIVADFDLRRDNQINDMAQSWKDAGAALHESVLTPTEKLDKQLAYIDELMRRNVISVEDYGRAYAKAFDEGNTKFDELDSFAKHAARNIQDSFANFLFDPFKGGLKGMAQGFGDMVRHMIAEAAAADLARTLFGDLVEGGKGSGLAGGLLKSAGSSITNLFTSANGNAFANAPALSAYSGSIISRPTLFPFANGIGLMGEAGAEAILPLKRGSDGKLGVSMDGGAGTYNDNRVYNIDARGADAGVEQRLRRQMEEIGNRSVDRSVAQVQDLNRRGALRLT